MATETIYVYLFDEGVDCWRPVDAVREGEDLYRIVSLNPDRRTSIGSSLPATL